ncbi:MAG: FAD-dependent oxidoreductase, partial [Acidimicrobiales bacterium]
MSAWGSFDRAASLRRLADGPFDVLVVGGGITGAGVALDAAARGLRTAVVERDDFAAGTSSKSSKLVHGGLRYLQNGDIRLVYEALRERQRLLRNAPHLVRVQPFLIPVFAKGGIIDRRLSRAMGSAMWMYDLTGGLRIGKLHRRLSKDKAAAYMPTLDSERLASGYLYYDARADDARLTLTIARTAALDHGATVANGCRLVSVDKDAHGRINGATVEADGHRIEVSCSVVVNATGVWADDVRAIDEGAHPDSIRPAKGIHITVPWAKVRNTIAAIVPVPGDKRSVFVIPWGELPDGGYQFTYVGTTDTDYDGPLDDPQCTADDVDYLLRAIDGAVTTTLTRADILGTWAGLRPLVKEASSGRTADLSRRHRVATSPSGLVTVTGGKLTTYREMAEDTVNAAIEQLDHRVAKRVATRSPTKRLRLRGVDGYEAARAHDPHLADRYGGEARAVLALADTDPALAEPLVPGLPYRRAEAIYAVRHEMARSLDDVLARRTRARLLARDASAGAAHDVADLIGAELGWTTEEHARQVESYVASVVHEREAA